MALMNLQICALRPKSCFYQSPADRALCLKDQPNGAKQGRYKYRFLGMQKRLALWRYPEIGLAEVRHRRDEVRRTLNTGTDPRAARKHERLVALFNVAKENSLWLLAHTSHKKGYAHGLTFSYSDLAIWLRFAGNRCKFAGPVGVDSFAPNTETLPQQRF